MTYTNAPPNSGRTFVTRAVHLLRRFLPRSPQLAPITEAEIERLADLSPHLLGDVGFALDNDSSSPQQQVWRCGRLTVVTEPDAGLETKRPVGRAL